MYVSSYTLLFMKLFRYPGSGSTMLADACVIWSLPATPPMSRDFSAVDLFLFVVYRCLFGEI